VPTLGRSVQTAPEPSIGIDPRWPMAKSDAAPDG
jgi:hypothetical protein